MTWEILLILEIQGYSKNSAVDSTTEVLLYNQEIEERIKTYMRLKITVLLSSLLKSLC